MVETEHRSPESADQKLSVALMAEEQSTLPPHLVRLPGTSWALWRWISLRAAGFPASEVLKLGAPECADAADALLEAEAELESARLIAVDTVKSEAIQATGAEKYTLEKALRRLQRDKLPNSFTGSDSAVSAVEVFRTAKERFEAARQSFTQSYEMATLTISDAIRRVSNIDRFQEAVIWQNRHAFHTGIASILGRPANETSRGSKQRQHEELVASYLQRYCLKNDTIGFFGPVGWAQFASQGEALAACPGQDLLATRKVYFEVWGLDALGETLMANEQLRPWIIPRRMSHMRLEGSTVFMAAKKPITLSDTQSAILKACDGKHTARQIAAQVLAHSSNGIASEADVFALLTQMEANGLITWKLEAQVGAYP
ncbi:MAG TPA: lantibiotic dehydratase [Pyrinomonadaceae bacterium]|nr:lantibiotic dehydratase [Pyrinomonadaceae bacterium]